MTLAASLIATMVTTGVVSYNPPPAQAEGAAALQPDSVKLLRGWTAGTAAVTEVRNPNDDTAVLTPAADAIPAIPALCEVIVSTPGTYRFVPPSGAGTTIADPVAGVPSSPQVAAVIVGGGAGAGAWIDDVGVYAGAGGEVLFVPDADPSGFTVGAGGRKGGTRPTVEAQRGSETIIKVLGPDLVTARPGETLRGLSPGRSGSQKSPGTRLWSTVPDRSLIFSGLVTHFYWQGGGARLSPPSNTSFQFGGAGFDVNDVGIPSAPGVPASDSFQALFTDAGNAPPNLGGGGFWRFDGTNNVSAPPQSFGSGGSAWDRTDVARLLNVRAFQDGSDGAVIMRFFLPPPGDGDPAYDDASCRGTLTALDSLNAPPGPGPQDILAPQSDFGPTVVPSLPPFTPGIDGLLNEYAQLPAEDRITVAQPPALEWSVLDPTTTNCTITEAGSLSWTSGGQCLVGLVIQGENDTADFRTWSFVLPNIPGPPRNNPRPPRNNVPVVADLGNESLQGVRGNPFGNRLAVPGSVDTNSAQLIREMILRLGAPALNLNGSDTAGGRVAASGEDGGLLSRISPGDAERISLVALADGVVTGRVVNNFDNQTLTIRTPRGTGTVPQRNVRVIEVGGLVFFAYPLDDAGNVLEQPVPEEFWVHPGGDLRIVASGLQPNSVIRAWIFSEPRELGVFNLDVYGEFAGEFAVPADLEPGYHTLKIVGPTRSGEIVTIAAEIFVAPEELVTSPASEPEPVAASEAAGMSWWWLWLLLVLVVAIVIALWWRNRRGNTRG